MKLILSVLALSAIGVVTVLVANSSNLAIDYSSADSGEPASYTAEVLAQDKIPPSLELETPEENSRINYKFMIRANASDVVGIAKIMLYVDGDLVHTETSDKVQFAFNDKSLKRGIHTIEAVAFDYAGNTQREQVTVTY